MQTPHRKAPSQNSNPGPLIIHSLNVLRLELLITICSYNLDFSGCIQYRGYWVHQTKKKHFSKVWGCMDSPPPHTLPNTLLVPWVFGLHPASNGISRGLIEAGRQLHQGAGSLAWEQGVAGLRGIGPCLRVMQQVWHACEVHLRTQCMRYEHCNILAPQHGQLGVLDGMGRVSDWHS